MSRVLGVIVAASLMALPAYARTAHAPRTAAVKPLTGLDDSTKSLSLDGCGGKGGKSRSVDGLGGGKPGKRPLGTNQALAPADPSLGSPCKAAKSDDLSDSNNRHQHGARNEGGASGSGVHSSRGHGSGHGGGHHASGKMKAPGHMRR